MHETLGLLTLRGGVTNFPAFANNQRESAVVLGHTTASSTVDPRHSGPSRGILQIFMTIFVAGKHLDVTEAMRNHPETNLGSTVGKCFNKAVNSRVTILREPYGFRVNTSVHPGHGFLVLSGATAADVYAAFDASLVRISKRAASTKKTRPLTSTSSLPRVLTRNSKRWSRPPSSRKCQPIFRPSAGRSGHANVAREPAGGDVP